jgi:S-adenosylmethionine decarboxylase
MDTTGRHLIMDLWECKEEMLGSREVVERILVDAALISRADVREVTFHQFEPAGVSGVVVISESHLTIHTFPEHGYASVDVYTCGDMDPHIAMEHLVQEFGSKTNDSIEIIRGKRPLRVESAGTDLMINGRYLTISNEGTNAEQSPDGASDYQ